jgi:hypothetical protein
MKTEYGNMPKIDDDRYWKHLYRRLLDSGLIRYGRTRDGRPCFVSTPAGRKLVQQALTWRPDTENLTGKK